MNAPVLLFGIGLSLLTVLIFGVAPAVANSKRDPNESLKAADPHASSGLGQARFRQLLVAAEVALSMVLLVASGLLVRSFSKFSSLDPGFNAERILTFRITLNKPDQESRRTFYTRVLDRVRTLPGVESAGAILIRPLSGTVGWDTVYAADSESPEELLRNPNGNYEAVSPGYFRTMG